MPRTGRPREFDRDTVLARARDLFWTRGYARTSVQDLTEALAVQRGSLYGAYGDKHALYVEAVGLYWAQNRRALESQLATGPVLPVLRRMLLQPSVVTGGDGVRRGCLVGNTTAQLTPDDSAAHAVVRKAFAEFLDTVGDALARAQSEGEVVATADPRQQAMLLLVMFQGSALLGRACEESEALEGAVDLALGALQAS